MKVLAVLLAVTAIYGQNRDRHVVVVSIDGFAAYALKDPMVPLPNLRKLIQEGVAADAMQPVNPTVTWPNHTSIVTGVRPLHHTVLYNGQAVRQGEGKEIRIEPHVPKEQLVHGTTIYDAANQAGMTTAQVDWVAIANAPTITWSFSEWPKADGKIEREMMEAGLITADEIAGFTKAPITFRDEMWTRAAEHILAKHKPNLTLVHLLTTDSAQHRYGARSLAGYTALALADAKVGRMVDACRSAGLLDKTTFIIVSDHGFKTYKRVVRPNAILKAKGLSDRAYVVPEGGTAMVYVTSEKDKSTISAALKQAFQGQEGVGSVLEPGDFEKYGYPQPEENSRMADLVLAAADGYAFEGSLTGDFTADVPAGATPGSHGFLHTDPDMDAIFIASGAGIKPGSKLGRIRNLDVAPTIANLLGIELKDAEGKALSGILQP